MIPNKARFERAIDIIDKENSNDPNREVFQGKEYPKELLYAQRMTEWLKKLVPDPSEALQLAARAQHICRWTLPRRNYSMDRKGYLLWRTELKNFHAQKTKKILEECEYDEKMIRRVQSLILKQKMKVDPESQALEDVICLVFLENYFSKFANQHDQEKVISIIRKTWKKMSEMAREKALKLNLPVEAQQVIGEALNRPF